MSGSLEGINHGAHLLTEAEKIVADAKETKSDDDVISRSVSRQDIIDAYNGSTAKIGRASCRERV